MSYHETYEFFAIDRCLSPDEMRALRAISTRAVITPARFYNFPAKNVDLKKWRPYVTVERDARRAGGAAGVVTAKDVLILEIEPAEDTVLREPRSGDRYAADDGWDDDWDDDEWDDDEWRGQAWSDGEFDEMSMDEASWPVPLALVRADLLAGDLLPLYILWLLSVQRGERRASTIEPPIPPGGTPLTGWLYLSEFLQLNADLLAVALETAPAEPRTAGQLLAAARDRVAERERAEAARSAAARRRRLTALAKRQEAEWSEIDQLLDAPKVLASVYRDVIQRLTELRELADDRGEETAFQERLRALLERRGRKPTLLRHVREAGLTGGGTNG